MEIDTNKESFKQLPEHPTMRDSNRIEPGLVTQEEFPTLTREVYTSLYQQTKTYATIVQRDMEHINPLSAGDIPEEEHIHREPYITDQGSPSPQHNAAGLPDLELYHSVNYSTRKSQYHGQAFNATPSGGNTTPNGAPSSPKEDDPSGEAVNSYVWQ